MKSVREAQLAIAEAREAAMSAQSLMSGAEQFPRSIEFLEAWDAARQRAAISQIKAQEAAGKAVQLTIKTYGLAGLFASGTIRSGPYSSSTATPAPLLSDNRDTYYRSIGTDGLEHFNGISHDPSNATGGYTLQDGQVVIMAGVFDITETKGDPRILASTLHHEGVHFRQLTTGRGWTTKEEVEAEAYNESIGAADVFGLLPPEKRDLYAKRAEFQRVRPADRTPLHGPAAETEAEQGHIRHQTDLAKIRDRERELAASLETARMDRERRAAATIPSPETIADITARNSWARAYPKLHSLAERACAKGLWGADRDSDFVIEWFEWRAAHYDDIRLDSGLSLWADMSVFPGPVNCVNFIVNQVVVARRSNTAKSYITPTWVSEIVRYAFSRSNPVTPTPPLGQETPEMTIPGEIPPNIPPPPAIPHCRYHPWCKG